MKYLLLLITIAITACSIIIPNYREPHGCSIGYKIPGCNPKTISLSER